MPLLSADRLADALDHMPAERAVLGLFCDLILAADLGTGVGDVGCGSGRPRVTGLGVEFDVYWSSPDEMEREVSAAGFETVFWGGRPAEAQKDSPQGYLLAKKS